MADFKKEYFDEGKFKKNLQEQEDILVHFTEAVENLNAEGIPTDYDFIQKLSGYSDEQYLDYIKGAFKEYISKLGLVVKAERKRIAQLYDTIYTNTLPSVKIVREAFSKGLVISDGEDGTFTIDKKKMKEEAKKRATFALDTESMEEYFNLIMGIKEAMDKAGKFEEKHGLYKFSDGESKMIYLNPYYPDFLCELTLPKYFKQGNCSAEYFQKMVCHFFRKEKK